MHKFFLARIVVLLGVATPLVIANAQGTTVAPASPHPSAALAAVVATCQNVAGKASAAQRVTSCTLLLKSTGFSPLARAHILLDRAFAYSMLKQWKQSLADYDQALKLAPKLPVAWSEKGFARLRMHQYAMAIADYSNALTLDPKTAYSWFGRGIARIDQGDKADGAKDLAAARQLDPQVDKTFARFGLHP